MAEGYLDADLALVADLVLTDAELALAGVAALDTDADCRRRRGMGD